MARSKQIVFCVLLTIGLATTCAAMDWRGIKPLHSTRNDVFRLLGSPATGDERRVTYEVEDAQVLIVFSGRQLCNAKTTTIPDGTVLLIQITPGSKQHLRDLQIDRKNLREFSPSSQDANWKGFIDAENGLIVRSYKDTVDQIFYIPAAKDRVRCPSYYADLEGIARIFVDFTSRVFDEYSNLPFAYEKARLDNFAIYLQKDQPTWKAYIVAYPGAADIADAGSRTTRAKQYLTSIGLSEKRIFTIIGEVRDTFTVELYALPPDSPPPTPLSVQKNRNKIQD